MFTAELKGKTKTGLLKTLSSYCGMSLYANCLIPSKYIRSPFFTGTLLIIKIYFRFKVFKFV